MKNDRVDITDTGPHIGGYPVVRWLAQGCAIGVLLVALIGWLAWSLGQTRIFNSGIGHVPMAPSTALAFILLGTALFIRSRWTDTPAAHLPGRIYIGGVALIAGLVAAQTATGIDLGFEAWLAGNHPSSGGSVSITAIPTGRMAPLTAGMFLLASAALWLQWPHLNLWKTTKLQACRIVSLALSILVFMTGLVVLFGYAAGIPFLYGTNTIPMAALTAIAFVLTGASLLVSGRLGSLLAGLLSGDLSETRSFSEEKGNLRIMSGILLLLVATAIPGCMFLKQQQEENRASIQRDLNAIGQLKSEQVQRWRRERLSDANRFLSFPGIRADLAALLDRPTDPAIRNRLKQWLNPVIADGFEAASVLDEKGNVLLVIGVEPAPPDDWMLEQIAIARRNDKAYLTDLHRSPGQSLIHQDVLLPVKLARPATNAPPRSPNQETRAVVIDLHLNPEKAIFSLLRSWPTASESAETILVRKEGDRLRYLTDLRRQPNAALNLTLPLDTANLPAARSLQGAKGVMEGIDYSGQPVLAAFMPIPDTPWAMVAKIDQAEVYAPLRDHALQTGGMVSLLLLCTMLGAGLLWRQRNLSYAQRQLKLETEGKRLAESLAELAAFNQQVLASSLVGIAAYHADTGTCSMANAAVARIFDTTPELMRQQNFLQSDSWKYSGLLQAAREALTSDREQQHQFQRLTSMGKASWFHATLSVFTNGNGKYLLLMVEDITQRKLAENTLHENEMRLRLALEGSHDCVWDWDITSQKSQFSRHWKEMLGYAEDEVENNFAAWDALLHPDDRPGIMADLQAHLEGRVPVFASEARQRCKDGNWKWTLCRGKVVSRDVLGNPLRMTGTTSDITERKQAELALRESENRFRAMFERTADALLLLDPQLGQFIDCNQATLDMLRCADKSEILPLHPAMLSPSHQPDGRLSTEKAAEMIATAMNNGSHRFEWTHCSPHREDFPVEVLLTPITMGEQQLIITTWRDITERKAAEEALRTSEMKYRLMIENTKFNIAIFDTAGNYLMINESFASMMGKVPQDFAGRNIRDLFPNEADFHLRRFRKIIAERKGASFDDPYPMPDGVHWFSSHIQPITDIHGDVTGIQIVAIDITERKHMEESLRESEGRWKLALEGVGDGVWDWDVVTDIVTYSTHWWEILGYTSEDMEALPEGWTSVIHPDDLPAALEARERLLSGKHTVSSCEVRERCKNGGWKWMLSRGVVVSRDIGGNPLRVVGTNSDITPMKEHQQELEHLAHFDVLTGLPNRALLADRLQQAMLQSQRRSRSLAVVYLDLDGFKAINDTQGHKAGDELLINVSQRMKDALREGDTLARIGGDEFVAVLAGLEQPEDCEPILQRMLLAAADPVWIVDQASGEDVMLQVSASIGVTLYPKDAAEADQLMRHADQAMYQAKQSGKNRYHVFDVEQDAAVQTQRESIDRIQQAIDRHEFVLHYQPKVNMRTGETIGVEALVRWQHPERGLLPPANFLPIIEEHAVSVALGEWTVKAALDQLAAWHAEGKNVPVSVNIGAHHLQRNNFVKQIAAQLDAHPDVDPSNLELEVLETSALDDLVAVSEVMVSCRKLGIRFALDDFGTGYSSLTYLRRLPAEQLKIDQSFVRGMLDDPDDLAIVNGVVGLAQAFGRSVIAEGVETIAHGELLLKLGCELAQGYGIARPMAAADLFDWIATWKPNPAWVDTQGARLE